MNAEEFINRIEPKAREVDRLYNIKASLTIAQAIIESNWGKSGLTKRANNLFGMKWFEGCGYDFEYGLTKEYISGKWISVNAKFKKYKSWDDSIDDHTNLLLKDRYAPVRQCKDYKCATLKIWECGYATSPTYPQTLRNIIEKYKLYEKDYKMDKNLQLTRSFKWGEYWSNNFGKPKVEPPREYFDNIYRIAFELQKVRDRLNQDFNPKKEIQIVITSGWRTKEWNASKDVEGAKNSKHLYGLAADSRAIGVPLLVYYTYICRYTSLNHLGYYAKQNFVHSGIEDNLVIFKY